jgi:hypothetical protein
MRSYIVRMQLEQLTKPQLHELFLEVHARYLRATNKPLREYVNDPEFIQVEHELAQLLTELRRRRGIGD